MTIPTTNAAGSRPVEPSPQSTLRVELGRRSYSIVIDSGATGRDGEAGFADHFMGSLGDCSHAVIVQDVAVEQVGMRVADSLRGTVDRISMIRVPSGEQSKSTEHLAAIWDQLLESGADRRSVVIAVGGGVVGDLAGFVAASFTRGIRFVQVPTTLLAMVDSSVGGKTGINLPGSKNMVGAFWQPHLVWIDTDFLGTLPDREYVSGIAEVIKYGVIEDREFFEYLESNAEPLKRRQAGVLREAILRSCQSKARVVADDERETTGRRAILNYGHTFAHAIEATAGYGAMLHGEAVAIGMQMAAGLAIDLRLCDPELLRRQTEVLRACGLPTVWPVADPDAMLPVMARDKKVAHGQLRFVLPRRIGQVELVGDVAPDAVVRAIESGKLGS